MNESSTLNESMFFKIIAFLSLTDTQVLAESGRYDRMLAYAMVFRQLVTFAFTFLLFTYGVSLFLGTTAAVITGFVFALTLFFLDQAIIGSDWALKNPFNGGIPFRKLLGLIPRIFYSLIIAIGLATLAEISLQSNAIDEQIQKDVVDNNQDYFTRMKLFEEELDAAVNGSEIKLNDFLIKLKEAQAQQFAYQSTQTDYDQDTIVNTLDNQQVGLEETQTSQKVLINKLADANSHLSKARQDYRYWFNEAIRERTGIDGRAPTEGVKYDRAVKTYEELKVLIANIEAEIVNTQSELDKLDETILVDTEKLNNLQLIQNNIQNQESNIEANQVLLKELDGAITQQQKLLKNQIEDKQLKLEEFRITLQNEGLFYERKTGVLTRYLALQKIHADPEFGKVATLFSYMLKIFFIAIELMPVIIKLFFSPFSFYSLKMYRKMQVALLEEKSLLEIAELKYKEEKENREKSSAQKNSPQNNLNDSILV